MALTRPVPSGATIRFALPLLLAAGASGPATAAGDGTAPRFDARLPELAQEARQTIAVIDWFYLQNGACPLPSRPAELAALQDGLGDGFSVDLDGRFAAIRGISMSGIWLYYASPAHADKCTLWRKLDRGPALIWRRHRGGGRWSLDPGDGGAERPVHLAR